MFKLQEIREIYEINEKLKSERISTLKKANQEAIIILDKFEKIIEEQMGFKFSDNILK